MMVQSTLLAGNIRHGFFTRDGGVSAGIYAGLNCGIGSADDQELVAENRRRATAAVGTTPDDLVTPYQTHSTDVAIITEKTPGQRPDADALVTQMPGIALGIVTADCVPILFHDPASGTIAAVHAGWKGTLGGIINNTIDTMVALGAQAPSIRAAIGPCIAQASYEIGPEVHDAFTRIDASDGQFFTPSDREGHFQFDLGGVVAKRLAQAGLDKIDRLPHDTYAEEALFYSYRRATHRGESEYGRQLSAIVLESTAAP